MAENINPQYKTAIIKAINYHFATVTVLPKIILFGSRARGTNKEGADVDVAVDLGQTIPVIELQRARVTMGNLPIPLEVDIVDLHRIPLGLKEKILAEGVIWQN